ncbi:methyl-accepting chemotaxis protein [Actinoplanes xinjiangensis]|uniref:Methyl-accepting chemotaxis sensory transducer with Pas/Pac sensor n=2 Tax=Actinoplanes xinjiangensis TaxID=512350 RepID=A0A316F3K8_9ACTN|nr:methyl-accepting chemotaxis protein [Actinoplanes xinjiangensis]PWK39859.1 methyl-accepting chemotaxis sensory transducer with Pas/Pac sensor [Actinoplanes xinjiangensis]
MFFTSHFNNPKQGRKDGYAASLLEKIAKESITTTGARHILDSVQANIFVADLSLAIIYANPKAMRTLELIGPEIERVFGVRISDVLHGSIHRFHKDPGRIDRILTDPAFEPRDAAFTFGSITLDTHINQVKDEQGTVVGYVVAWEDVTALREAEERTRALTGQLGQTLTTIGDASTSLHSVASAMEQLSSTVSEIARSESRASEVVAEAVTAIDAATSTMTRLTDASGRIDEVVSTISQIARQTNLLALNATIEAARAGIAGKGFAVVAGEVKDLSSATQAATERIGHLIVNAQTLSGVAGNEIAKIAAIVDAVRANQSSVAAAVEEQTATNQEITRNLTTAASNVLAVTDDLAAFLDTTSNRERSHG